jgi:hypothetical protein
MQVGRVADRTTSRDGYHRATGGQPMYAVLINERTGEWMDRKRNGNPQTLWEPPPPPKKKKTDPTDVGPEALYVE